MIRDGGPAGRDPLAQDGFSGIERMLTMTIQTILAEVISVGSERAVRVPAVPRILRTEETLGGGRGSPG